MTDVFNDLSSERFGTEHVRRFRYTRAPFRIIWHCTCTRTYGFETYVKKKKKITTGPDEMKRITLIKTLTSIAPFVRLVYYNL